MAKLSIDFILYTSPPLHITTNSFLLFKIKPSPTNYHSIKKGAVDKEHLQGSWLFKPNGIEDKENIIAAKTRIIDVEYCSV